MCKSDPNSLCDCTICGTITAMLIIIAGILGGLIYGVTSNAIVYQEFLEYSEQTCNITNITYPTQRYSLNYTTNWYNCRCSGGKDFPDLNGVYGCIQMYPKIKQDMMAQPKYGSTSDCSMTTECGCNDIGLDQVYLESQTLYSRYYNNNIECYYNNEIDNIYLETKQPFEYNAMIGCSIFLIVVIGIISMFVWIICKDHYGSNSRNGCCVEIGNKCTSCNKSFKARLATCVNTLCSLPNLCIKGPPPEYEPESRPRTGSPRNSYIDGSIPPIYKLEIVEPYEKSVAF